MHMWSATCKKMEGFSKHFGLCLASSTLEWVCDYLQEPKNKILKVKK